MSFYIGIDIAKDKFDLLWLRDPKSLKVKTKIFKNTQADFEHLKNWLEKNITTELADIYVCMEATGIYHESLAYALYAMGVKVSVINPAFVKNFAKGLGVRSKTDKKDSFVLARYCVMTNPGPWKPEPEHIREIKALLARLEALEKDLQRECNRLEKVQISHASKTVITSIELMIKCLEAERDSIEKKIDEHIDQRPDLKQDRIYLNSIPGIGSVLSREMLSLLRSRDFSKASQSAAFVGLAPRLWESGKLKGRTTLCKNGPGRIRAKLYMAAIVAKQYNPDVKALYDRLVAAGKTKMQALGAAMRKLVHICFGVLKHQCKYQSQIVR
ncbi:Mobile element protein [hydrothermal vent metagenome]|uniref:Mobile element protein n=1 Tax=hydrothermal vent metagenome TaxID=652676 RepID=A0A3B0VV00_9ZZZZ